MSSPGPVRGRWLALIAALLGWMFDGMEMGLFPLVGRSAVTELLRTGAVESDIALWFGIVNACFLIGAATGGVLFGWLGDKIGRIRAMTFSVLVYSLCSGLSAASAEPWQLAGLRFLGALGMGGEWALGVALVMEMWPNASRAWLAGWIGAFGNLGYFICGTVAFGLNRVGAELPGHLTAMGVSADWAATLTANGNWRLLMLFGAVPALLTLFIRLFVPESEKWQREKDSGAATGWATRDLIGVLVGAAAAGGVVALWAMNAGWFEREVGGRMEWDAETSAAALRWMRIGGSAIGATIVIYGYLYPARGYLSRSLLPATFRRRMLWRMILAAGLSGVPLLGTWAGLMWMYQWVGKLPNGTDPDARPVLQMTSALGAAAGCMIGALLAGGHGRRIVYAGMCVLSLVSMVGFYQLNTAYNVWFVLSATWLGFISASFYGWLPLYLPELFRTAVRATGQGFGFNFGRIIAAAGNLQMANLLAQFNNDYAQACAVVAGVYCVGLLLIAIAPETKGQPLPD